MKKNIHRYERGGRIVLGVILTVFAFVGPASPWFLLGLIPLVTGLVGTCPLYLSLNLSTREQDNRSLTGDNEYFHHA
jgi:hypothetical protein